MIFSSYEFIFLFLPLAWTTYMVLARFSAYRAAMIATIIFSLAFFARWNPPYVLLLISLIVINYAIGKYLFTDTQHRKAALAAGISINLAVLGYFKYTDFMIRNVDGLFGLAIPLQHVVLPLAISFFTFQKIAFLVDVYQGKISKLNFQDYCLFVVFFPQLIAGPIVHYRDLQPQFDVLRWRGPAFENVAVGIGFFLIGLFKKVAIADSVSHYATPIFNSAAAGHEIPFTTAWIAALAYTFQLYFDFNGYSDMAIGLARMFSVRLPYNFNSPYKALSIVDFWHRWHMTLSAFLRQYLYIPLGGNRCGKVRRYVNLMVTMLLGGLWHGAGWTFVVWGGLHGLYLIVNHLWREYVSVSAKLREGRFAPIHTAASWLLTFLCVVLGWVFFRAADFASANLIINGMIGMAGFGPSGSAVADKFLILGGLLALAVWAPNSQEIMDPQPQGRWRSGLVYMGLGVGGYVALMLLHAPTEFIYFRF